MTPEAVTFEKFSLEKKWRLKEQAKVRVFKALLVEAREYLNPWHGRSRDIQARIDAAIGETPEPTCDFCHRNRSDPIHDTGHVYVNRADTTHLGGTELCSACGRCGGSKRVLDPSKVESWIIDCPDCAPVDGPAPEGEPDE